MKRALLLLALGGCASGQPAAPSAAAPSTAAVAPTASFDAAAAWDEFEVLFRSVYAYLDRGDFDVEAQVAHAKALALETTEREAFRRVLHRFTFAFTDTHLVAGPLADEDPNLFPTSSDLIVRRLGDTFVVQDVRAGSAADAAGVRPGWTLIEVDGRSVTDAVEATWAGVVLAETAEQWSYGATLVANGLRNVDRSLVFDVEGERRRLSLANPRRFAEEVSKAAPIEIELRGRAAVVRLANSLGRFETIEAFDRAIASLRSNTDGIVVDLRNTPSGGNTDVARAIIGHFVTDTRAYQVHEIPAVERSTTVPRRFIEQVLPRAPHYPGRVAVLGGHWTGSMGEGLVIGLHAAAGARTFGSDMADILGALHNFDLEHSGVRLDIGAEALFHVDGTPREDYVADVAVERSDRDPAGGDPLLEAAVRHVTDSEP